MTVAIRKSFMGFIAATVGVFRAGIAGVNAAAPLMRRLRAEIFAGKKYGLGGTPQTQKRLDEAFSKLGAPQDGDPWWKQAVISLQATIVRPEHFTTPHVKEWLSHAATKRNLQAHVLDLHFSRDPQQKIYEQLLNSYSSISGEDRQHALSIVDFAISFLRASLDGAMRDPELAELIQGGHREQEGRLTSLAEKVDELASTVIVNLSQPMSPLVAAEAENAMKRILRRRMSVGQTALVEMGELWAELNTGGKYDLATNDLRVEVIVWLARMHAANRDYVEAMRFASKLQSNSRPIPQLLKVLLDYANGKPDEALKTIRDIESSEGRSLLLFLLANIKGANFAASNFLSEEPLQADYFTPHGWRSYVALLLSEGKLKEAEDSMERLSAEMFHGCTDLHYLAGVLAGSRIVADERRRAVLDHGLIVLADGVLDGPEAKKSLRRAISHFASGLERAEADAAPKLAQQCKVWMRALRLLDEEFRPAEILAVQEEMKNGKEAVKWIQIASRLKVSFDVEPLESHLARQQLIGGLSDEELVARLEMLRIGSNPHVCAAFIEQEFDRLSSITSRSAIVIELIQALCNAKEATKAADLLSRFRSDLGDDATRVQLMIDHAMGEDPSAKAIQIYKESGLLGDLDNVVNSLKLGRRWSEVAPFALELFNRQPNAFTASTYANALQKASVSAQEIATFLERAEKMVSLTPDLLSMQAWTLYSLGVHERAKDINDNLLKTRDDPNDFGLDVNLAVQTGDWGRFPELLIQAREKSATLPARALIAISHIAGTEGPTQAFQLANEAVIKEPENPNILVSAYGIAIAAGRDRDASDWMQRAIKLSKADGPVQAYSFRELVELVKANSEARSEKNEKFRKAEVPLHFSASMFNVPLAHLLLGIPKANRLEADARHRLPIPIWSGARKPLEGGPRRSIALDATSIFILHDIGLLGIILQTYDDVYISPSFFGFLLHERQRAVFHQPSRITEAKSLLALLHRGVIKVVRKKPDAYLEGEIGSDSASVLTESKQTNGWFVHSGPLYKLASYGEAVAEVGEYASHVTSVFHVANWLTDQGHITPAIRDFALQYLERVGRADPNEVSPAGNPDGGVYLDGATIQYLADAQLLMPLINATGAVHVHQSIVNEWEALVDTEPGSSDTVEAIATIRNALHQGLLEKKVKFLRRKRLDSEEKLGLVESGLLELLSAHGQVEALCIDDRMLNSSARIGDVEAQSLPLLTSADLVEQLVATGWYDVDWRRGIYHRMREGCFYCVPLKGEDLEALIAAAVIADGVLRETAELRVLREYLSRLHSADVLCTPADLHYLDELWRVGATVIHTLWSGDQSEIDAATKSSWILNYVIPDAAIAMAYADSETVKITGVASARATQMLLMGVAYGSKSAAYMAWLQQSLLHQYIPGATAVVDALVDQTAIYILQQSEELSDD